MFEIYTEVSIKFKSHIIYLFENDVLDKIFSIFKSHPKSLVKNEIILPSYYNRDKAESFEKPVL